MPSKNSFNLKGSAAEQLVTSFCREAFFEDFCFKNPYHTKGKELCDILVVLNEVAIIWQIKNIKLKDGQFNSKDIEKAIRQCRGARRQLLKLGIVTFKNINNKDKIINTFKFKEVFLIAAIEGGTPNFNRFYDDGKADNSSVHIFLEKLTRFATKHLNTVSDFIEYLRYKEKFFKDHKHIILCGGEENLLALYLRNNKSFGSAENIDGVDRIYLDLDGEADELEKNDVSYAEKLKADEISKGWDFLIKKKREGLLLNGSHPNNLENDKFLQKMMSHNRFERRILAHDFLDAAHKASELPYDERRVYRRLVPQNDRGVTYLFAFMGNQNSSREIRQKMLYTTALAAKQFYPQNDMLIALATEFNMVTSPSCSFEWVMIDMPSSDFEHKFGNEARRYRKSMDIWMSPEIHQETVWEYPSDARKSKSKKYKQKA